MDDEEYPEKLLKRRREQFKRDIVIKNATGLSRTGCRNWIIVIFIVIVFLAFLYFLSQGKFTDVLLIIQSVLG